MTKVTLEDRFALEPFAISKSQGDAVAERVEKIVVTAAISVSHAKALDLFEEMVSHVLLVNGRLVECVIRVLDHSTMDITGPGNRSFVLAHGGELRVDRLCGHPSPQRLLQKNGARALVLNERAQ